MTTETILKYQIIASTITCLLVLTNLYFIQNNLNFFGEPKYFTLPIIPLYCLIDLPFAKQDSKVHHVIVITLAACKFANQIVWQDYGPVINALYFTEISTIFYNIKLILPKFEQCISPSIFKQINTTVNLGFFVTFFKFRIWDYYWNVTTNMDIHENMEKYYTGNLFMLNVIGFQLLNLYWFILICKIAFKPLIRSITIQTARIIQHKIVSYLQFVNLAVIGAVYSWNPQASQLIDMAGVFILSVANYRHHNHVYELCKTGEQIEYTSGKVVLNFITDQLTINLRYALALVSIISHSNEPWKFIMPIFMHIGVSISNTSYIRGLVNNKVTIEYYSNYRISESRSRESTHVIPHQNDDYLTTEKTREFTRFIFGSNGICLVLDLAFTIAIFNYNTLTLHLVFSCCLCFMIIVMEPFYELNHVAFHLASILQGFCFARVIIR